MTNKVMCPTVYWAQRSDRVLVSIQLEDITEEKIEVDGGKLVFRGMSNGHSYEVNLEFNNDIIPEQSKQKKLGREYYFDLKKKDPGPYWPRLLKDAGRHLHIKIDFNRWKDEEDSDEEEGQASYDDASLEDMMQQMGTNSNSFDPGEVPDSEDSDDDDIPHLQETEE